jgi:predicted alpha/beta-fold hydrolase
MRDRRRKDAVEVASNGNEHPPAKVAAFQPSAYRPAWWLPGPHAQTIAGRLLRRPPPFPLERERIETPDDDFIDLDFEPAAAPAQGPTPAVIVLHGLEGSSRRGYAFITYDALARRGLRSIGMNFRSCSGEPNRTARFYHSGETDDLRFVLRHLRTRFGPVPLAAIGFSLGGNVLLKYLGEEGKSAELRAAVAISVPFDLAAGALVLEQSVMGRFYSRIFLESLIAKAVVKAQLFDGRCNVDRIRNARTLREFDDAATAPLHGFASAEDYYARSSSAGFLDRIRIPTLLIHSLDDPFLPPASIPRQVIDRNPNLTMILTRHGGHVGFISGAPWAPIFWAEAEAARFVAEALAP